MVKILIKVQSISDLITNSSSEVFVCKNTTKQTLEQVKTMIEEYHKAHIYKGDWDVFQKMTPEQREQYDTAGGMGGDFSIEFLKDYPSDHWLMDEVKDITEIEKYFVVDTDWCHRATINYLQENFEATVIY